MDVARLAPLVVGLAVAGMGGGCASGPAEETPGAAERCGATKVAGDRVRVGPFVGLITRPYDVQDGRFRLRVGGLRDPDTGLSQKIPWFVPRNQDVAKTLSVAGRRLDTVGRFRTTLQRTSGTRDTKRWVFPSILRPPKPGCWRLRFSSGSVRDHLRVLVVPGPTAADDK